MDCVATSVDCKKFAELPQLWRYIWCSCESFFSELAVITFRAKKLISTTTVSNANRFNWTKFRTGTQLARIMFKQQHSQIIMKRILQRRKLKKLLCYLFWCVTCLFQLIPLLASTKNSSPHARASVMFEPARHVWTCSDQIVGTLVATDCNLFGLPWKYIFLFIIVDHSFHFIRTDNLSSPGRLIGLYSRSFFFFVFVLHSRWYFHNFKYFRFFQTTFLLRRCTTWYLRTLFYLGVVGIACV